MTLSSYLISHFHSLDSHSVPKRVNAIDWSKWMNGWLAVHKSQSSVTKCRDDCMMFVCEWVKRDDDDFQDDFLGFYFSTKFFLNALSSKHSQSKWENERKEKENEGSATDVRIRLLTTQSIISLDRHTHIYRQDTYTHNMQTKRSPSSCHPTHEKKRRERKGEIQEEEEEGKTTGVILFSLCVASPNLPAEGRRLLHLTSLSEL